jgi:hypothetical protein
VATVFQFALKTDGSDLVIWVLKSLQQFLGLDLKTKWMTICRLRHKTDGGRTAWDTRRDLAVCFGWTQVALGFSSQTLRLAEARLRVVHVASSQRLRRVEVEDERVNAIDCVEPFYPKIVIFMYYVLSA